ncbi:NAD(P)-binding protein [Candidatus Woesearchaeota archaeon]|nr:NAD(P)-binding protein [Candidatus Woesearchaeota archaeon]
MQKFDIAIAGAGPAGLSAASKLSKHFDVLVFDNARIPHTTHSWYSYKDRIKKHNLEDSVLNSCSSLVFKAVTKRHVMKDNCVVLDGDKILKRWHDIALSNKAAIGKKKLKSYRKNEQGISIKTDKGKVDAKLLIDCTGCNSPILKKNRLINHTNTWLCYGSRINNISVKDNEQIKFLPLMDKHNTYTTFYPISNNKADFYIFRNLENKIPDPESLKPMFSRSLKKIFPKAKKLSEIKGNIVSGELKSYALDNVAFFGESGMLTPPACGMGFNEILMKHSNFSKGIKKCMDNNNLDKKSLSNISLSLRDSNIVNFQRIIGKFSYYFINSPDKWDGGVEWLNSLGNMSRYWMRNQVSLEWITKASYKLYKTIPFSEAAKYMPRKDLIFIATQFARFMKGSIIQEAEEILKNVRLN